MKKFKGVLLSLFLVFASLSTPAHATVINHDEVVGFKELTPTTITQIAEKRFQPYLKVFNGSVPFPAVDKNGNTGGGLALTGSSNGSCGSSIGQIYARSTWYNGVWAIMYAWYFPKDESSPWMGHRHDWEGVIVWIDNPAVANPKVLAISNSMHGGYGHATPTESNMSETHPLIGYESFWPLNHQTIITNVKGGTQPLIDWNDLTVAARNALTTTDFGDANVPFKDANFGNNLEKAWFK